jgi:hypothetical protein
MDEIKQEKLRNLVEEILSGGLTVESVNYEEYTEEELIFIDQEIDRSIGQDVNNLTQMLDAEEQK